MSRTDRTVGRPRSLTMAQIIDTAIELGLKELNMKSLASELGVNVVTLYRHIGSRDELMRTAVMHLMLQQQLRQGSCEHWAELAFRYAKNLFDLFHSEPGLLIELLNGNLLPHSEIDILEQFLQAMAPHGFSYEAGLRLHRDIGAIVLGGALGVTGLETARNAGHAWEEDLVDTLSMRDDSELLAVRDIVDSFVEYGPDLWLHTLHTLLTGVALQRGETLPAVEHLLKGNDNNC